MFLRLCSSRLLEFSIVSMVRAVGREPSSLTTLRWFTTSLIASKKHLREDA